MSSKASALVAAALLSLVACKSNPVENKPMATVSEPSTTKVSDSMRALPGSLGKPGAHMVAPNAQVEGGAELLEVSPTNSKVEFVGAKVTGKHTGSFKSFTGTVAYRSAFEESKISLEVDVASLTVDAGATLEKHLKSADFFDTEKFPKASFTSDSISKNADGTYTVKGTMEIHGVKKTIGFPATVSETPEKVTLKSEFGITRKDFGVVYPGKPNDLIKDEFLLKIELGLPREKK